MQVKEEFVIIFDAKVENESCSAVRMYLIFGFIYALVFMDWHIQIVKLQYPVRPKKK